MITLADLQAVYDKMAVGDFLTIFVNKSDTGVEVVFYPKDANGDGAPMPGLQVQSFLGGWLLANPIPGAVDEATQMPLFDEETGEPIPSMTALQWFAEWLRQRANDDATQGLQNLAVQQVTDPAPP